MRNSLPAFPRPAAFYESGSPAHREQDGMSLRDYFAGQALIGLMGRSWQDPATGDVPDDIQAIWAVAAYEIADRMLAARM